MYLSYSEYMEIENLAVEFLKNFTVIPCEGYWKEEKHSTLLLIYFADEEKHYRRFTLFYKVVKQKLPVAHYIVSQVGFYIHRKKVNND